MLSPPSSFLYLCILRTGHWRRHRHRAARASYATRLVSTAAGGASHPATLTHEAEKHSSTFVSLDAPANIGAGLLMMMSVMRDDGCAVGVCMRNAPDVFALHFFSFFVVG